MDKPFDGRMHEEPWDEALRQKLLSPPYKDMKQGGVEDATDPPGILEQTDDKIAEMINAEVVDLPDRLVDVPVQDIAIYLVDHRALHQLKVKAQQGFEAPNSFVDRLALGGSIIGTRDADRDRFFALLDSLDPDLAPEHVEAIKAMFSVVKQTMPYWQSIGAPGPFNRYDFHRVRHP